MKMVLKLSAMFWISFAILVVYGCSHPVHASMHQVTFECNGERLIFTQQDKNPILLEVVRTKGIWMQVPSDKPVQIFYNLDSGKVAKVGKNYSGAYYVEFYKDTDYANAFKPERTLPCRTK
ncbi:hypothetical protein Fifi44_00016 [Erwinia phage Fifi44]|uniref:Uncharacterized protein n=1 Tax=Erwinia phage Fifi44 TaxID=2876597 RepID=A0AAE8Y1B2_9CAUD|nr:hypothetical protein QNG95_gp16 [Erwinia phage Fifi44]UCR74885.1 hypothetical protein Fifi44_00016 [Erwinia phage Fifi44]UCR80881.1 hypothetical protein Fifi451_00061 [Erwinia phage Fifi451]